MSRRARPELGFTRWGHRFNLRLLLPFAEQILDEAINEPDCREARLLLEEAVYVVGRAQGHADAAVLKSDTRPTEVEMLLLHDHIAVADEALDERCPIARRVRKKKARP